MCRVSGNMDRGEKIEGDGRHPWPSYCRVVGVTGDAGRDGENAVLNGSQSIELKLGR